jgi:ATP-dependent DNA helicase 2 subunit 1
LEYLFHRKYDEDGS